MLVEILERFVVLVTTSDVCVKVLEVVELGGRILLLVADFYIGRDALRVFLRFDLTAGVANDVDIVGQEALFVEGEEGRESL